MTLALLAMSHSPLLEHAELDDEVSGELEAAFAHARRFVHDFDPDVVVNVAPDHYNGFFYRLMPAFCIGYAAESIGDYGSQKGRLNVPEDLARALAETVIGDGIDLSVSLDMQVDHGAVQPVEIIYGDITAKPFVPVFINSVAPPFTPVQRVRLLGESLGRHLATLDNARAAVIELHLDRPWPDEPAGPHDQLGAAGRISAEVKRDFAFNHGALAGAYLGHVDSDRAGNRTELTGMSRQVRNARAPDFVLAWQAGDSRA